MQFVKCVYINYNESEIEQSSQDTFRVQTFSLKLRGFTKTWHLLLPELQPFSGAQKQLRPVNRGHLDTAPPISHEGGEDGHYIK